MRKVSAGVLLLLLTVTVAADAQSPQWSDYNILAEAARYHWLQFTISSGRLVVGAAGFFNKSTSRNSRTEWLNIRTVDGDLFVQYDAVAPDEQIAFELRGGKRIHLSRNPRGGSAVVPLDFQQDPHEPLRFTVGDGPRREVFEAASLWHLLVEHPDACKKQLVPLLEIFRPEWQLSQRAREAEEELFRMAGCGQIPDRQRWAALVAQLSDDRFARREAADRDLRAAGPALLPYLQSLDFHQLDAEQQARLRRIMGVLTHALEDDTAQQIASWMIADPEVWLALLARPDEPTRRLAAAQLTKLLGQPVTFDPAADASRRKRQIDQLRARPLGGVEGGPARKTEGGNRNAEAGTRKPE
jgi:hypothetical protein